MNTVQKLSKFFHGNWCRRKVLCHNAPVAQPDRATDFESVGCVFKSRQARILLTIVWYCNCKIQRPAPCCAYGYDNA
jgi:hypothetical protein